MNTSSRMLVIAQLVAATSLTWAADLKQSKFTQVVNDVKVIAMPAKSLSTATVSGLFKAPDILRTGPASRAELIAEDKTVTRVGANSIFSFDSATRTMSLEQGNVLFHSPKGKGGGTVRTTAAAASVLGTTIMVSATPNGGFKILTLEGTTKVRLPNGKEVVIEAGQMVFVLPGGNEFSGVITFRLRDLVKESQLVNGFDDELPTLEIIRKEIDDQERLILKGGAEETGLLVGDTATTEEVEVVDDTLIGDHLNPDEEQEQPHDVVYPDILVNSSEVGAQYVQVESPVGQAARHAARGRNIFFQTQQVDLSTYGGLSRFDFIATAAIEFLFFENQLSAVSPSQSHRYSTYFTGLGDNGQVNLIGDSLKFPTGRDYMYSIYALMGGGFSISTVQGITLGTREYISFYNPAGPVSLASAGDIYLDGGNLLKFDDGGGTNGNRGGKGDIYSGVFFYASFSPTNGASRVSVTAAGNLYMKQGGFNADKVILTAGKDLTLITPNAGAYGTDGSLFRATSGGTMLVEEGQFYNYSTISLSAGNNLTVNPGYYYNNNTFNLTAKNTLTVEAKVGTLARGYTYNGPFYGTTPTAINMSAHTVVLRDINFPSGSVVNLKSALGVLAANPNTGQGVQSGKVNFIYNVLYNGSPAQNYIGYGINISKR